MKSLQAAMAPATSINPYPYIGVVKNNLDPTRCGRVQVFIPELGGNPDDQANWRTLSYASPFMGYTSTELKSTDAPDTKDAWTDVSHTYGMWMVPPDVGVEVICVFIAGDPMRGYWIACVNDNLSRYMLPALGSSMNTDLNYASTTVTSSYSAGNSAPVTEFNENIPGNNTNANFYNLAKPIHEPQYAILKQQGLNLDTVRGTITSSSQRETPSQVFGISTPGRPLNDPATDPNYVTKLNAGTLTEDYYRVKTRKGGHTFVMDDGSVLGVDQLVRLRTALGHQFLMHDTEKTIYIGHSTGNSWVELSSDGSINMYSQGEFNLRSQNTINIHGDGTINVNAGDTINMRAKNLIRFQANNISMLQSNLSITAGSLVEIKSLGSYHLNTLANISINTPNSQLGNATVVANVTPMVINYLGDSFFNSNSGTWSNIAGTLSSIVTAAPTHEPYVRSLVNTPTASPGSSASGTGNSGSGSLTVVTNSPGIESLTYSNGVLTFTPYALPTATTTSLGGVVVDGNTIVINSVSGRISATGNSTAIQTNSLLVTNTGLYQPAYTTANPNSIVARDLTGNVYANYFIGNSVTGGNLSAINLLVTGNLYVTATNSVIGGNLSIGSNLNVTGNVTAGSINGTPIGNKIPSTGAFTTLSANAVTTLGEVTTVSATAATGTINFDVKTQGVLYYTTNASANWTLNFRGDGSTALDTLMAIGETRTVTFMATQGSPAYYNNAIQVDGTSVTAKWQGGASPTVGNTGSIDIYTYSIIKTASATFTVLASQTRFA
jgi:hypothetical protein